MKVSALIAAVAGAALVVCPSIVKAGGFDELPDQGAEALGRGAAFTAKADDTTAIYWNVAGLARQRGTKLAINANVHFNTFYFARAGQYADDSADPTTPWGGEPYPLVQDKNKSFLLPMISVSSDFGLSERLTFGLGVFGPAATGRTFPIGLEGKPAPSRYDFVQSSSSVLFPTVGAAYRVTRNIDVGLAGHLVLANLNEMSISYADLGGGACKSAEDFRCDAEGRLEAKGASAAASVGVLARVTPAIQIGAQLRSPTSVTAEGTVTTKLSSGAALPANAATATLDLPWIMRAGVRYIGLDKTFEKYDVELDGTYEGWGGAQGDGPTVVTTDPTGATKDPTTIVSTHRWKNTFSVRAGGAYNLPLHDLMSGQRSSAGDDSTTHDDEGVLSVRAGFFYDSPTTDSAYTRLDTNTLAKIAATAGVGFKKSTFSVNLAYAAVLSLSRTVTDGDIRPSNGAKQGAEVDGEGNPLPVVNNGEYRAFSHILSLGVEVNFEALFFKPRPQTYGDPDYEPVLRVTNPADEEARAKAKKLAEKRSETTEPHKEDETPIAKRPPPSELWFAGQDTDDDQKADLSPNETSRTDPKRAADEDDTTEEAPPVRPPPRKKTTKKPPRKNRR